VGNTREIAAVTLMQALTPEKGAGDRQTPRRAIRNQLFKYGMVWVLVLLAIVAGMLYQGFWDTSNLNNLVYQVAPVGIVAIGMTFVIVGGGFDLSVGAVYAGGAVLYARLFDSMPQWLALAVTLIVAAAAGVINGLIITKVRVNPFIATLATASLFTGIVYLYSGTAPIVPVKGGFPTLGQGKWLGIWIPTIILLGFVVVGSVVFSRSVYGRTVQAVGGNSEAARLAGIRVHRVLISNYVITALCAGLAGAISSSETGVGQANVGGNVPLEAIAIVIVGGTALLGGEGAIWRTVVGILIWGIIESLFGALALDASAQLLLTGAIVLVAVALDSTARRTLARR
jgi:ribose transport system permease protein